MFFLSRKKDYFLTILDLCFCISFIFALNQSYFQVPGNFHISTHSVDVQPEDYDFAHEVHEVSFGSKIKKISSKNFRSSFNPLGGR